MRRFFSLLFLVLLPAIALAADKPLPDRARGALERAYLNEREAVARYDAFAKKAEEEGYPGVAALFRAASRSEGVHAERFASILKARGAAVPEVPAAAVTPGTTSENLRSSGMAETGERDGIYKDCLEAARSVREEAIATAFDQTRDTEVEHANLFQTANRQLEKMKNAKSYFVCDECGFTSDLDLAFCVLCRAKKHPHEVN